jgi:hypothetical protein
MNRKHYDFPVYWALPDDGALFKCCECNRRLEYTKVILCQIPKDDSRRVLCYDCVDEDWLNMAKNLGDYTS